jgi:hypothetical protein
MAVAGVPNAVPHFVPPADGFFRRLFGWIRLSAQRLACMMFGFARARAVIRHAAVPR